MRTIARHRYLEVQSVACFLIVCAGTEGRYSPSPARSLIAPRPPLAGAAFLSARVSSPSPRLARRVRPAPCRPSTWQPASCRPRRVRPAHCLYAVSASRVRGLAAPCRQSQTNQPAVDSQILRARACVSTARACARARVVCVWRCTTRRKSTGTLDTPPASATRIVICPARVYASLSVYARARLRLTYGAAHGPGRDT